MPSGTASALAQITPCCFWNWRSTTAAGAAGNTTNADRSTTLVKPRPLTKLPAERTTVQGPLNTSSCAAAPFRHVFPNQPETSSRTPPGLSVYSAQGPMPAMYKTITMLSTEITHCHKQSYCNSTFFVGVPCLFCGAGWEHLTTATEETNV